MWLFSLLCCAALPLDQPNEERPDPAAMILTCKAVDVIERGESRPQRAMEMNLLFAGDELRAAEKGEALLFFFSDGHRERLRGGARATVGVKGCTPSESVIVVPGTRMSSQTLATLRELSRTGRMGGIVVRNIDLPELPRVTPLYDSSIMTQRPTLQWAGPKVEGKYLVEMLTDPYEGEPRLLWQVQTSERRLVYPAKEKPLQLDERYRWRVRPIQGEKPGEPLFESRFSVLSEEQCRDLTRLAPLAKSDAIEDMLILANVYDRYAVYDEALCLYQRLVAARPRDSNFLVKLAGYYELAGRLEEAKAARARAKQLRESGSK